MDSVVDQPGQLLGPLTTAWSMPETCSIFLLPCSTCTAGFRAQSCNAAGGGSPRDNTACWPPASLAVISPTWPFNGWGVYSPGLACPSGYSSACTAVYGNRPQWPVQFSLLEGETGIGCCPTGYACANIHGNTCVVTASTSVAAPTALCDDTTLKGFATQTFPDVITTTASATESDAIITVVLTQTLTLYAPMFQLNFRASDLPASEPTTDPTTTAASSRPSQTETPQGRSGVAPAAGLSTGAKAGIGAAAGVAVALIIGAVIWLARRRKAAKLSRRDDLLTDECKNAVGVGVKPATQGQVYELSAPSLVELPGEEYSRERRGDGSAAAW